MLETTGEMPRIRRTWILMAIAAGLLLGALPALAAFTG
jgi:hypothetical protein